MPAIRFATPPPAAGKTWLLDVGVFAALPLAFVGVRDEWNGAIRTVLSDVASNTPCCLTQEIASCRFASLHAARPSQLLVPLILGVS